MLQEKSEAHYTYADYMNFDDNFRCEIIDGVIYDMSPAPSSNHQRTLIFLCLEIGNYLKGKTCEVFPAPFDVFLRDEGEDIYKCDKIVQPDITVVCDKSKIQPHGCVGAPDFIIEIVSHYRKSHDYVKKLNLYNDFKVREYWIVNPESETVLKYISDGNNFSAPVQYTFDDRIRADIFDDLEIDLSGLSLG